MSKHLYHVNPENGHLYVHDGISWLPLITTTPADWYDDSVLADRNTSSATVFTWRGRLFMRYFASDVASRFRVVEIINLNGIPEYDFVNELQYSFADFGLSDEAKIHWSNLVYYRGNVIWMGWPEDGNAAQLFVFGDLNSTGQPALNSYETNVNGAWTGWETLEPRVDPHASGHLFAHDEQLLWAARGSIGRHPTPHAFDRLFKLDVRKTATAATVIPQLTVDGQYDLQRWDPDDATPGALDASTWNALTDGILCAGTIKGKLIVLRPNLCVDIIDDTNWTKTRAFDLRDNPALQAVTGLAAEAPTTTPGMLRQTNPENMAPGSTNHLMLLGGRVEVTAGDHVGQISDLAAFWNGGGGMAGIPAEFLLLDPLAGTPAPALNATDVMTISYGALGSIRMLDVDSGQEGGAASAMMLEHNGYVYIIVGTVAPQGDLSAPHMNLIVARWDGVMPAPTVTVLPLFTGGVAEVLGLDAIIDVDSNVLNILYGDVKNLQVRHRRVDLTSFTELSPFSVHGLPDREYPSAVKPGGVFGFTVDQPYVQTVSQTYDGENNKVELSCRLFSQAAQAGLSLLVEYNIGSGWAMATADSSSDPTTGLNSDVGGVPYTFVHDLAADAPTYVGAIQYRLTITD